MNEAETHAEPIDPALHHAEQALFSEIRHGTLPTLACQI
jgi:hypothetical protein